MKNTILGYNAGRILLLVIKTFLLVQVNHRVTMEQPTEQSNIVIGINEDLHSSSASNRMNIGGVLYADLSANKVSIGNSGSALSTPSM